MHNKKILTLITFLLLSGCAEYMEGDSQNITVNTAPSGAQCSMERKGLSLGTIASTPGNLHVNKTKDDIALTCTKKGYNTASQTIISGYPENNWAYILVGGPIGWAYDSAVGADNYYKTPVTIELSKK